MCVRDESARRRTSPAATGERSLSLRLLGAVRCEHGEKRVGDITALSYGKNDRVVASYSPRAKAETQLLHSPPGESLTSESLEAFDGRRQGVERAVSLRVVGMNSAFVRLSPKVALTVRKRCSHGGLRTRHTYPTVPSPVSGLQPVTVAERSKLASASLL